MSSEIGAGGVYVVTRAPTKQIVFLVVSIILIFLANLPGALSAEEEKDSKSDEKETFSQSPTNHEKVLTKKKHSPPAANNGGDDDYWVGSHKLEFKPHPLLMPSTQAPRAQIPIPLIEMGLPPTTVPTNPSSDGEDSVGSSSEDQKKKVKQRKSRDRRKKSRNQRLLTHRTLWAKANASNNLQYLRALQQQKPQLLQQSYYVRQQQQQQPSVILTSAGVSPVASNSLYLTPSPQAPPEGGDSFRGTATTWDINHPGNSLPSYLTGQISSSQENLVQSFQSTPIQQIQFGYSPLTQTQQFLPQHYQFPPTQLTQAQQQPLPISPSAPDVFADNILMNSQHIPQHYIPQQQQVITGAGPGGGPVIVYVPTAGIPQSSPTGHIPVQTFSNYSPNEIPTDFHQKLPYSMTETSGVNTTPSSSHTSGKATTNPQYFRNNFIRIVMDKLATVGKVLPIPFVTKYTSSQNHQQSNSHFHRRM